MATKRIEHNAKEFGKLFQEKREFVLPKNTQLALSFENVKLWNEAKKLVGCGGEALKIVLNKLFAEVFAPYQLALDSFSTDGELNLSIEANFPAFYFSSTKDLKITARAVDFMLSISEICKKMTEEETPKVELKIDAAQKVFITEGNPSVLAAAQGLSSEETAEVLKRVIAVPADFHMQVQGNQGLALSPAVVETPEGMVTCVSMSGDQGLTITLERK